jgi:DNA polymerase-3 subunit alpha
VSYAVNAYLSAYAKAHFPKIFFASYLRFAKDKIDPHAEIKELVQNANEMDITICPPDLRNLNELFILKNNKIYFGLTDIKGVGGSVFQKIKNIVDKSGLEVIDSGWMNVLVKLLLNVNSTAAKALIQSGALSYVNKNRNTMLFEYDIVSELTKKELEYISPYINSNDYSLTKALSDLEKNTKINKKRKEIIQSLRTSLAYPPRSLEDSPEWLSDAEYGVLGCSITCSRVDMYDISMTNTCCRDFKNSTTKDNIMLGAEIDYINVTKTKTGKTPGQEMAFLTLVDNTGSIDSVILFPEAYREYRNILFAGNVIIVKGSRSKSGDGLIVEKCYIPKS